MMATKPSPTQTNADNQDRTNEIKKDESAAELAIQKIYCKDMSFEAPNTPDIFRMTSKPELNVDLQNSNKKLENDVYEVVLSVTVTAKLEDKVAFLVEVQQAGIFTIKGFDSPQQHHLINSFCPSILFPYIRKNISDAVGEGGFPPFYLQPINFDAIYEQQMQKMEQEQQQTSVNGTTEAEGVQKTRSE